MTKGKLYVSRSVAFTMSGSDISSLNPEVPSGYDTSIAEEYHRVGCHGTYYLTAPALRDLAEFCDCLAAANADGGEHQSARALRICRDKALAEATKLES